MIFFIMLMLGFRDIHFNESIVKMGGMTYSIYLMEYFTTAIYKMIVLDRSVFVKVLMFVPLLAITVLVSYISYVVVECKLTGILNQRNSK